MKLVISVVSVKIIAQFSCQSDGLMMEAGREVKLGVSGLPVKSEDDVEVSDNPIDTEKGQ